MKYVGRVEDGRGDRVTTYGYSGLQTAIRVCGSADSGTGNCLNLSRTTDSTGRFVETLDANGGRTRFWYDAAGSTLALEDANGVVTRAAYNARASAHPSMIPTRDNGASPTTPWVSC